MIVKPQPVKMKDGGVKYKCDHCEMSCYKIYNRGYTVDECAFLSPDIMHGYTRLHCTKGE